MYSCMKHRQFAGIRSPWTHQGQPVNLANSLEKNRRLVSLVRCDMSRVLWWFQCICQMTPDRRSSSPHPSQFTRSCCFTWIVKRIRSFPMVKAITIRTRMEADFSPTPTVLRFMILDQTGRAGNGIVPPTGWNTTSRTKKSRKRKSSTRKTKVTKRPNLWGPLL